MKTKFLILAIILGSLGLNGCQSGPPQRGPRSQDTKTNKPTRKIKAAGIFKAAIFNYVRRRDGELGIRVDLKRLEIIKGEALVKSTPPNPVLYISTMANNFPWVKDREYFGSIVYVHLKSSRGQPKVVGWSETADGPVTPFHGFR